MEKNRIMSSNRSLSIILLVISIVLLAISCKIIIDFALVNTEKAKLMELRNQIMEENKLFEDVNSHLQDDNYYDVFVREEYQFQGQNVIKLPK